MDGPRCAMVAAPPDPGLFRSASDFAASRGLTPSQHSSGGKERLGGVTKTGNRLSAQECWWWAAPPCCGSPTNARAPSPIGSSRCGRGKPERVVAVALANKLARIASAMMSTGESFRKELCFKS
jgi:transposase